MPNLTRVFWLMTLLTLPLMTLAGCSKPAANTSATTEPSSNPSSQPSQAKDSELLQGTWKLDTAMAGGKSDMPKGATLSFKGSKVYLRENERQDPEPLPFTLDESKQPKEITVGPNGDIMKGIYELNGDDLKICFSKDPDKARPTSFESKPGSELSLLTLKRDKNAPPIPEEKEPKFEEFPAAIVGKWKFDHGETKFGYFAPNTEFTKDGRVLQLKSRTMMWEEKYTYKFDKDELVLTPVAGKGDLRFKIISIDDTLESKRPNGTLKRLK